MKKQEISFIITQNCNNEFECKVKFHNRKWWQKKTFGIYYLIDSLNYTHHKYKMTITDNEGQAYKNFKYALRAIHDFEKQYSR